MRTNVDIDERLIQDAMRKSGSRTKKAVVEAALRLLVQIHGQSGIRKFRGKVKWKGTLKNRVRTTFRDEAGSW